jgi:hypothetical protein
MNRAVLQTLQAKLWYPFWLVYQTVKATLTIINTIKLAFLFYAYDYLWPHVEKRKF